MSKQVIVVTDPELGWDCVCGVFSSREALLDSYFNEDLGTAEVDVVIADMKRNNYILHHTSLDE